MMKIIFGKIKFFAASILIVFSQTLFSFSQISDSTHIEWKNFGSAGQIAYIDVSKLKSNTAQSTSELPILLDWNMKSVARNSFYRNGEMYNNSCNGGSVLRQNVIQFCLPYADIGYHLPTPDQKLNGEFFSLYGYGLNVYYETDKKRFYFFGCCWNYSEAFGPFSGDPEIEIPKAVKPRRKQGLNLKIETKISQHWRDPKADEEAEILEKAPPCMTNYCPPTLKELQYRRLNGLVIKIRLKNKGNKDLYLYPFDQNYPAVLTKSIEAKEFYRQNQERRLEPNRNKEWKSFPRGATYEFEIEGVGREKTDALILLYFNDKPVFWDEIEYGIKFRSMYRKFKTKK
ncbi:MAG TPA: hypothetical protein VNB22_17265 [Pyrinomonadaceae bacterium]|nr:hypothetical protein [Pyrinomonadaceae bacterium]